MTRKKDAKKRKDRKRARIADSPAVANWGKLEQPAFPPTQTVADVVICVHNAPDDVRRCLASVVAHTDQRHTITLVDDASAADTRDPLRAFAAAHPRAVLLRNDERLGYTRSANRGLRASRSGFVVLLNSDTIVTPDWLERLLECAASDPAIGIVGPLSNAATFQSVPECLDADGEWVNNPLPPGWEPADMAALVDAIAPRAFPRVGFVSGFCFGIKREVIDAIGYFDELSFPDGYGEEQDYCLRAARAGFHLAIADHAHVYHAGSRSYSLNSRRALKQSGLEALRRLYGNSTIRSAIARSFDNPTLRAMQKDIARALTTTTGQVRT
jgi:GT2 family glycosyltransferase